jgi:eukaryotic-like serine/threonine-protein kinase
MSEASLEHDGSRESLVARVADEFRERRRRGERPGVEEYTARHPEAADLLRNVLAALDVLDLSQAHRGAGADDPAETPAMGVLGDFRILREVGRGGMGVVYEAEQVSLGRRVALKVLPFAAALDARQLQRFHNEARAAAGLHHSNIVPVYGVGQERGVHYYAMQFIDGQTLAALIRQLRRPAAPEAAPAGDATVPHVPAAGAEHADADVETPLAAALSTERAGRGREYYRTVARWGVQAAEALDYAHQVGVVHRDVKPANLMAEGRGQLWVTDFGLARIESEASLTATGDLVGTLRYMSPEQALAKRVPIDHRTDVYSLGATLYELLTLRPVFGGADRQELLRQIAFDEPVPPRRLERGVPVELEVIVLKALEKDAADRYATAQELADDLRRFLEDRPIQARRPGPVQRLTKWGRRHQPLVWAVVWFLLLMVLVLATSSLLICRENLCKAEALRDAQLNWQSLQDNRSDWEARNKRLQEVIDGLERTLDQVVTEVDRLEPNRVEQAQRAVAAEACRFYEGASGQESPSWWGFQARQRLAWAYVRLGNLRALRSDFAEANDAYEKASNAFDAIANDLQSGLLLRVVARGEELGQGRATSIADLLVEYPELEKGYRQALALRKEKSSGGLPVLPDYRKAQARVYEKVARALSSLNPAEAKVAYGRAHSLREAALADFPADYRCRFEVIDDCRPGAGRMNVGRSPEALLLARQALAHHKLLIENAKGYPPEFWGGAQDRIANLGLSLATWFEEEGARPEAVQAYQQAVALSRMPWPDSPEPPGETRGQDPMTEQRRQRLERKFDPEVVVIAYTGLARLLMADGRAQEAEDCYRQVVSLWERTRAKQPGHWSTSVEIFEVFHRLGWLLQSTDRFPEAEKAYREALKLAQDPHPDRWPNPAASIQNDLAWLFATCPDTTFRDAGQAVALAQQAVQTYPEGGAFWNTLGVAQYRAGNWDAAREALAKSVQLRNGGDSFDFFFLAMAHWQLGDQEQARTWYDKAVQWMETNKPQDEELRRFRTEASNLLGVKEIATDGQEGAPGKE